MNEALADPVRACRNANDLDRLAYGLGVFEHDAGDIPPARKRLEWRQERVAIDIQDTAHAREAPYVIERFLSLSDSRLDTRKSDVGPRRIGKDGKRLDQAGLGGQHVAGGNRLGCFLAEQHVCVEPPGRLNRVGGGAEQDRG